MPLLAKEATTTNTYSHYIVNELNERLWLAAVVTGQPKSTEVPDYPHNQTIPMFVHRIGLLLAIHWQHSFVQNTTKVRVYTTYMRR